MALAEMKQINGLSALKTDVEAIKKSYDAAKVITTIVKTEADGENPEVKYDVNALLQELKSGMATILGSDSEGGEASDGSLAAAINNIKNKTVKDAVRVKANAVHGENGYTVSFAEGFNLSAVVPSVDTSVALGVYTLNNEPVYDTNGNQLTFSLADNTFSGAPAELDIENSVAGEAPAYKAITSNFEFKVFPIGSFTFETLPADALLDNEEMQLLAYQTAINKIVVELAKDKDLMDAIKTKVGETSVAAAIEDALKAKLDKAAVVTTLGKLEVEEGDAEGTVYASDEKVASEKALVAALADKLDVADFEEAVEAYVEKADIATAIGDAAEAVNTKVASQKAVADAVVAMGDTKVAKADVVSTFDKDNPSATKVASEVGVINAIDNAIAARVAVENNISERVTALESIVAPVNEKFNWENDDDKTDKNFSLANTPNEALVKMYVNHLTYFEGEDFTVNRTSKVATWTSSEFNVEEGDAVRFEYYTGEIVSNTGTVSILHQDAIPTTGNFKVGDRIYRLTVTTGENVGWICTKAGAGAAAEWTEFGIVDFDNTIYVEEVPDAEPEA